MQIYKWIVLISFSTPFLMLHKKTIERHSIEIQFLKNLKEIEFYKFYKWVIIILTHTDMI